MSDNDNSDNNNNDNNNEEKQKQRPNAKYKLSKDNANLYGSEIVHYYNRERRLEKAPQSVLDLYATQPFKQRFSLIRPLIKTKSLAMQFFTIIVICVLILVFALLGFTGTDDILDGNYLIFQAVRFEGTIIMAVNKSTEKGKGFLDRLSRSDSPYTGSVDIAVQPVLKSGEAREEVPQDFFYHKIFFTLEPQEQYRFSIPFDANELAVVLRTETKTLRLTVKVE